ncbi:MAG: hypothetical protein PHT91_03705 [Candidatus Nanoarchaeia archaeon]|nr:hypothetical protein [Candidatus Nanoarchaeia archaeon]MDD5054300.1 hypothetical protein [Candidatus Nanoarchaeia archaeon]MDD5499949.1 hypothetical protein [Candidatus Nanoarchaeia archaeon]
MNPILILILAFLAIDAGLMFFHKSLKAARKKSSKKMVIDPGIKTKMLNTIHDLNKRLSAYEKEMIDRKKHDDLIKKYSILLNSHRELIRKNEDLRLKIEKLKEKIY